MSDRAHRKLSNQIGFAAATTLEIVAHSNSQQESPTLQVSAEWQHYYSYFDKVLFDKSLPDCVITFTKLPGTYGYFRADSFRDRKGNFAHEIAMNPVYFAKGDMESFATLVHEMCHLWRHLYGPRNRKGGSGAPGYHDKPWADKMEAIGLMPSHNGKPGGKRTGFYMLDYPIEGGRFDLACRELLISGHTVNWRDGRELVWFADPFGNAQDDASEAFRPSPSPVRKNTRTRFVCPQCDLRAWSRASAKLSCNDCNRPLVAR
ncbi:MAG: SprT-like domain-containing protein [Rhizobiaceae bacterium]|nr:SprT-like domain-containing protein [Rhizobiaceae bacterium]